MLRILIVDDSKNDRELTKIILKIVNNDLEIVEAASARKALEILEQNDIECIISDYDMPVMNGLEMLKTVRENFNGIPFIFLSDQNDDSIIDECLEEGADEFFGKSCKLRVFEKIVKLIFIYANKNVNGRIQN